MTDQDTRPAADDPADTADAAATESALTASQNTWDSALYDGSFSIITRLGAGVLDLLDARPGERILDLGCGTGHLTARIAEIGAETVGIDASPSMVEHARAAYPDLRFEVARGEAFSVDTPVDAVFSNAALHWMPSPASVAACVYRALRPGGRFVAEMGGLGNVAAMLAAIRRALVEDGIAENQIPMPWYFPSIGEYATILERVGFLVRSMTLFDRPTPLDDCPNGAADWVRMFGDDLLAPVPSGRQPAFLARINELARPLLFADGRWVADYRRLRFIAVRPA